MGFGGRVAFVTGAASGIGASAASGCSPGGAAVALCDLDLGRRGRAPGDRRPGGRAPAHPWSISGLRVELEAAVIDGGRRWGRLDAVAACAGVVRHGKAPEFAESDWDYVIDTNLKGFFLTAKYTIPALAIERRRIDRERLLRQRDGELAHDSGVRGVQGRHRLDDSHARARPCAGRDSRELHPSRIVDTSNVLRVSAGRRFPEDPQAAIEEWGRRHPLGRVLTPVRSAMPSCFS